MSGYTQLAQEERYQIYILKKVGHKQSGIAEIIGRDPGTISRELRRNQGLKGYRPRQAYQLAMAWPTPYKASWSKSVPMNVSPLPNASHCWLNKKP